MQEGLQEAEQMSCERQFWASNRLLEQFIAGFAALIYQFPMARLEHASQ